MFANQPNLKGPKRVAYTGNGTTDLVRYILFIDQTNFTELEFTSVHTNRASLLYVASTKFCSIDRILASFFLIGLPNFVCWGRTLHTWRVTGIMI